MATEGLARIVLTRPDGTTVPTAILAAYEGDVVSLTSKDLDLADDGREKYVDAIVFDITDRDKLTYLEVDVYARNRHNDELILVTTQSLAWADNAIFFRASYRYWRIVIRDTLPLVRWKLSKISFFGYGFDPQTGRGTRGRL